MTITVELPPEVEARFIAEARRKGVPLGEIVEAYLVQSAPSAGKAAQMSSEESDRAIDELFDNVDVPNGVQEGAFHRENWY